MPSPVPQRTATLYDVLGVARDAKLTDITRAYNRLRSEVKREDRPPDLKRETMLQEAYETLSDPDRREAYDASLVAPDRRHRSRMRGIVIGTLGVAISGGYLLFMRESPPPAAAALSQQEILGAAAGSVGRVRRFDLSGQSMPVGMAYVIGERLFVGSCKGVAPESQLVVSIPPRSVPVRIVSTEPALGLCRLLAEGAAGPPLGTVSTPPRTGDLVYAAKTNDAGELLLTQSTVKRVVFDAGTTVIEAAASGASGAPLFDTQGRVIAVATDGEGRHVPVPAAWIAEAREPFREPKPPTPAGETPAPPPAAGTPATASTVPKTIEDIPPERREKLEKAFRPPPDTKDDWIK